MVSRPLAPWPSGSTAHPLSASCAAPRGAPPRCSGSSARVRGRAPSMTARGRARPRRRPGDAVAPGGPGDARAQRGVRPHGRASRPRRLLDLARPRGRHAQLCLAIHTLALVRGSRPVAGLVVDLSSGRRWCAAPSLGGRVDGVAARPRSGGLLLLPSTEPHRLPCLPDSTGFTRIRLAGATSIDLCRVADGSAGGFIDSAGDRPAARHRRVDGGRSSRGRSRAR